MSSVLGLLSKTRYVSGNEIGKKLNISRAAVHKQINSLKNNGYIIESSRKGYKLLKSDDILNKKEISSLLFFSKLIKNVIFYKKITSTQIKIKEGAERNLYDKTLIIAQEQTSAYGRMKREWSSQNGGLWFSFLLAPKIRPDEISKLSLVAGMAINRVLKEFYLTDSKIKWTNDILIDNKKIAGILIEISAEQDKVNWVAVGIGINLNNDLPENLTHISTSLKKVLKRNVSRKEFLGLFIKTFENLYFDFQKNGFSKFFKEYNKNIAYMNLPVKVDTGFDIIKGVNKGVDEEGKLILKNNNKTLKIISGTLRED